MPEQLRANFSYIPEDKWGEYSAMFRRLELPAKTILLREGEISKKAFFIEKGCLRAWFNNAGRDITFQFFFEGRGLASVESFRKKIPSFFTIESIEPSVIYEIHKKDLDHIMAELEAFPEYNRQILDFVFNRQFHYMKEFLSFIRDTPAQRYENLLEEHPEIVKRVPQHYIASYLGITSVSLSRIRSKILRERK
ncbi:Crp/Fnr family transcriptional regulator [Chitinophagaceae bacterium MMS25-I14]